MSQPVTATELAGADLNRALIDASLEVLAALRARPRNQEAIDVAQARWDELKALKVVASGG